MEEHGPDSRGVQITLCVGGLLVSGVFITYKMYLQLLLDGRIHDILEKAGKEGQIEWPLPEPEEAPRFIHLMDAKFRLPGQGPLPTSGSGVLWRGRIDRIGGFNLGELGIKSPEVPDDNEDDLTDEPIDDQP